MKGKSAFELPEGWVVEKRTRPNSGSLPGKIDKYYVESSTGKTLRSMPEVELYLKGKKIGKSKFKKISRKAPSEKKPEKKTNAEILPRSFYCSPNFVLPHDWVVETHERNNKYTKIVDKYYIEPETGQRFRSLVSVERYLNEKEDSEFDMRLKDFKCPKKRQRSNSKSKSISEELSCEEVPDNFPEKSEEDPTTPKEVVPDNDSGPSEHSDSPKKTDTAEETEAPKDEFGSPPSNVNWVLAGPGGDMWNPYLNDLAVPDSTKQKWSERFVSSLDDDDDDDEK